jgi:hypothetical protein
MDSNLGKSLIFVAIIVMWVAPFAISSVQQARRERSRAKHPTARKWLANICLANRCLC